MVLKILGLVAIAFAVLKLGIGLWYARKLDKFQDKSSHELKAMILDPDSQLHILRAVGELKSRGEDLSFARPTIARMLSSENKNTRFLGHLTARSDFRDLLEHMEYNWRRPDPHTIKRLQTIANEDVCS